MSLTNLNFDTLKNWFWLIGIVAVGAVSWYARGYDIERVEKDQKTAVESLRKEDRALAQRIQVLENGQRDIFREVNSIKTMQQVIQTDARWLRDAVNDMREHVKKLSNGK